MYNKNLVWIMFNERGSFGLIPMHQKDNKYFGHFIEKETIWSFDQKRLKKLVS